MANWQLYDYKLHHFGIYFDGINFRKGFQRQQAKGINKPLIKIM